MQIIDWEKKGNVVRFYLGADDLTTWHGDDWNDRPYECNAGTVYSEFVVGTRDIAFPFDMGVYEPVDGYFNSPFCKDDLITRDVPCIIVVPSDWEPEDWSSSGFASALTCERAQRFYFGDAMIAMDSPI